MPQLHIPLEAEPWEAYISLVNGGAGRAMEKILNVSLSDAERWEWYAAGDKTVAPRVRPRAVADNEATQVVWEMGIVFAVPLVVALVCWLTLS